jgi:hypothetical protein
VPNQPPRTDGDRHADLRIKDHPSNPAAHDRAIARLAGDVAPLLAERDELRQYVAQLTHDLAASERAREAHLMQRDAGRVRMQAWRDELKQRVELAYASVSVPVFDLLDAPVAPKEKHWRHRSKHGELPCCRDQENPAVHLDPTP